MQITLPSKTLFDSDLSRYVDILRIPHFRGVLMRDELPNKPLDVECGILNLNTHTQRGSHWICWYKWGKDRYFFDSFGEAPPLELLKYLKTSAEFQSDALAIHRSAVIVQHWGTNECGSLCLFVLKSLSNGIPFSTILSFLSKRFVSSPLLSPLTINI